MHSQLLSKEFDLLVSLNLKDLEKLEFSDLLDKNGTIKEMKAEDLKRKDKQLKRTDIASLFKLFILFIFSHIKHD